MTSYTNSTGLPGPIYRASVNNAYVKEEGFSAIELVRPARQAYLESVHDVQVDVKDGADTLLGNALHAYLAAQAEGFEVVEQRFSTVVDGHTIHGQIDYYHTGLNWLVDWKSPRVASWNKDKDEWEAQLNLYAYLLSQNGYAPQRLSICSVFKDYSPMRAEYGSYPPSSIALRDFPLWAEERVLAFIRDRLEAHVGRGEHTLCSDAERWIRPKYAAIKPGAKRASKLFDSLEDAIAFAGEDEYEIEYRAGQPTRCLFYCGVAQVCAQHQGEGL